MGELDGRAEALTGTFNAQNVANTLWAYATMGQSPGAGLMGELEGRAETLAGTFNLAPGAERQTLSLHTLCGRLRAQPQPCTECALLKSF
jgi:hypothetical protein